MDSPPTVVPDAEEYVLRLYVAGLTPRSLRAIDNLKQICADHLQGRYDLEVVDIYQDPAAAAAAQIIVAPTLIKQRPAPERRYVGDLSDTEQILAWLDLLPLAAG
ncbi:MAG TPA: circadian clock KaiB family protein [Armatimonadota bacterium]|jgi:circadian clock protein KaiB